MSQPQSRWTQRIRSILASVADVAGDWLFWYADIRNNKEIPQSYALPVLVVTVLSTLLGLWNVLHQMGCTTCLGRHRKSFCQRNGAHLAEILLEDVPQLILSVLITWEFNDRTFTIASALNMVTSGYNLILDLLDMMEQRGDNKQEARTNYDDTETGSYRGRVY